MTGPNRPPDAFDWPTLLEGEGNGPGSKLPPLSPYCLYPAAAPRGGVITQHSENPDPGEQSCRPFLDRSRFGSIAIAVLYGWCITEQDRSPPTFVGARNEGLRLRKVDCPPVGGRGPSENDDWQSVAARTEATETNKHAGKGVLMQQDQGRDSDKVDALSNLNLGQDFV